MKSMFRHLVSGEVGVSAVLATALDPAICPEARPLQETLWADFARLVGIDLSARGPSAVYVEYPRNGDATTDILLVWDDWAVFVENKIKRGSIRRGQLDQSYTRFAIYMRNHPELRGAAHIAMVFLTPGGVGAAQLDALRLHPGDHKAMLNWDDVLPSLERAFSPGICVPGPAAPYVEFVRTAVARVRHVLARGTDAPRIEAARNDTPQRVRCKEFMRRLEKRLAGGETPLRPKGQWNNEEGDILFGDAGAKPTANWYVTPLARDGGSTVGEDGTCDLRMKLEFKVDTRAPLEARRQATAELRTLVGREKELVAEIGIPDADLSIRPERCEVTAYYRRSGRADELLPQLDAHVRALVARFRAYFEAREGGR